MSFRRGIRKWTLRFLRSERGTARPLGPVSPHAGALLAMLGFTPVMVAFIMLHGMEDGFRREVECLALNIYFEARNEPEDGRRAVAHVVLNRVADERWPNSPCEVVRDGYPEAGRLCQFSWYCDGRSDRPRNRLAWRDAQRLAGQVYWGLSRDPTGGAFWYHADYVKPRWRRQLQAGPKIGRHIFYFDPQTAEGPIKRSI